MSARRECEDIAKALDLTVVRHNPGSGTKVRVYEDVGHDWFDWHYIFATAGQFGDWGKTLIFLQGYQAGRASVAIDTPAEAG
jgi:hypothetical protein